MMTMSYRRKNNDAHKYTQNIQTNETHEKKAIKPRAQINYFPEEWSISLSAKHNIAIHLKDV